MGLWSWSLVGLGFRVKGLGVRGLGVVDVPLMIAPGPRSWNMALWDEVAQHRGLKGFGTYSTVLTIRNPHQKAIPKGTPQKDLY